MVALEITEIGALLRQMLKGSMFDHFLLQEAVIHTACEYQIDGRLTEDYYSEEERADMGIADCKAYFATLYNKDGEGNTWKGAVKKHLAYPEMFLIGKDLWEKILPEDISFQQFVGIYKQALEEIRVNARIVEMIRSCVAK